MSGVSFNFPNSTQAYGLKSGLRIDGKFNNKDPQETAALDLVLQSVFPKSSKDFRENVIRDIACGAYTSKATTPGVNAIMVQLLRNLREGVPTPENSTARQWLIQEISAANPGRSLDDIYTEVCALRYTFVSGARDTQPYENPPLPRISSTLYQWDYFPTLITKPLLSEFKDLKILSAYKKVVSDKNITLEELKLLTKAALKEKDYILGLADGPQTYKTRLAMLDTFLKTIQGITLLTPEQLISFK